mmetsp:Transcript_27689/g.58155  ORF Transcript_27689/g.58155 Transcript_27689/m.58155 type:complete len:92 (-) Transcript_27689:605-880(-)
MFHSNGSGKNGEFDETGVSLCACEPLDGVSRSNAIRETDETEPKADDIVSCFEQDSVNPSYVFIKGEASKRGSHIIEGAIPNANFAMLTLP